jgi:hypothetical protein
VRRNRTLLAEILESALPSKVSERVFSVDLVAKKWASAVGEDLARRSEPEALSHGVLTVRVTDAAWGKMIARLQERIIPALNRALGKRMIRRINFTKRERLLRPETEVAHSRKRQPLPAPPESIVRAAESIPDPELRRLVGESAARYLSAREERRRKPSCR